MSRRAFFKGTGGDCFVRALAARGIAFRYLARDEITRARSKKRLVVAFEIKSVPYFYDGSCLRVSDPRGVNVPGPLIDGSASRFVSDKFAVTSLLRKHNIGAPEGNVFPRDACREAEAFFTKLLASSPEGVCAKPCKGHLGQLVHVGIRDVPSFRSAFVEIGKHYETILIEETVLGTVYRVLCVAGRVVAFRIGRPASVKGDGIHTITELVRLKNAERRRNPSHAHCPIRIRERELAFIRQSGLTPDDVPEAGRLVYLSNLSNRHQGADCIDVTDAVHQSYITLVQRSVRLIPDLYLCGADVAIQDVGAPANEGNYHVLELNTCPAIGGHQYPWEGRPRDVAGAIADSLFARRRSLWTLVRHVFSPTKLSK